MDDDSSREELLQELRALRRQLAQLTKTDQDRTGSKQSAPESKERPRLQYDQAPVAYQILDPEGRFLEVNQAWLDTLGYSREEVLGRHFGDFMTAPGRETMKERLATLQPSGRLDHVKFDMVRKDGSAITVSLDGRIVKDGEGNLLQSDCVLLDISAQKRVEAVLQESDGRFRAIFDTVPVGMALLELDGRPLERNPAMKRMVTDGLGRGLDADFRDFTHPDDLVVETALYQEMVAGRREGYHLEKRYLRRDGQPFWVRLSAVLIRGAGGEPEHIVTMVEDIAEARRAEDSLKESEERYRTLLEAVDDAVIVRDPEGRYLVLNSEAVRRLGRKKEDLIGKTDLDLHGQQEASFLIARNQQVLETGVAMETIEEFTDRSFAQVCHVRRTPLRSGSGGIIGVVTVSRDISERRRAEEAQRQGEEQYRALLEAIHDAVNLKDRQGRYLMVNSEQARRMGLSKEEVVGKTPQEIHDPYRAEQVMKHHQEVLRTGRSMETELQWEEYPGGSQGVRHIHRTPLMDSTGHITAVVTVSRDITELAKRREELRYQSLMDELTGLYNRRGFLAMAEHQLRIADRMGTRLSLLFADLDGLKEINDFLGHQMGDRAIAAAAKVLGENCRDSDVKARMGGDEFAVLVIDSSNDGAKFLIKRLRDALSALDTGQWGSQGLSMSIGVAHRDPGAQVTVGELLGQADRMMYQDKRRREGALDLQPRPDGAERRSPEAS